MPRDQAHMEAPGIGRTAATTLAGHTFSLQVPMKWAERSLPSLCNANIIARLLIPEPDTSPIVCGPGRAGPWPHGTSSWAGGVKGAGGVGEGQHCEGSSITGVCWHMIEAGPTWLCVGRGGTCQPACPHWPVMPALLPSLSWATPGSLASLCPSCFGL